MLNKLAEGERWALLDCDDVLVDWIGGFQKFVSGLRGTAISTRPDSWDLSRWLGVLPGDVTKLINRFNETDRGFESLAAISGAHRGVSTLRAFGYRTAIITSSSVHPSSVERRARNVSAVFGDLIERLHIVPLGESKEHVLKSYSNAIWVEDNPKNAEMGARMGHRAFLMRASHNVDVHGVERQSGVAHVHGWDDLTPMAVSLLPDPRAAIGVREASLRALEKASEAANHGQWTPRNPDSDAMRRLVECGVVNLTVHPHRRPTAELTGVGFAALGISPAPRPAEEAPEFEI